MGVFFRIIRICGILDDSRRAQLKEVMASLVEKQLKAPDAIMEHTILRTIAAYVQNEGNPEDIVQHLADGYRGYADMITTLSDWLVESGMAGEEVTELIQARIQSLITQHFNVDQANSILGSGKAPWLNDMIAIPTWRKMIYTLSQSYADSPFLNLVIKRICDAGYLDEISHVTSVANEVDVFSAVISHSITKFISQLDINVDKFLADFCQIACQSQHTYLFTQGLLHSVMSNHRHSPTIKRLSQELEAFATTKQRDVWLYSLLFSGSSAFPVVVSTLQSILHTRELSVSDISKLHDVYTRPSPPPVDLLRVPALFELLISNLFSVSTAFSQDHLDRCIYILAYAASARDEVVASGYVRNITLELQDTIHALEAAITTLREGALHASAMSVLYDTLKFPAVSQGVLFWLRGVVTNPSFFTAFNSQIVPTQLALVDHIATFHELLHAPCLALLKSMMAVHYNVDPLLSLDVQRMILDRIIYLLSLGHVLPVLDFVFQQIQSHDLSLTLHFVTQCLAICGPPFSPLFVESFLKILARQEVTASLKKKPVVMHEAILTVCRDMRATAQLPAASVDALDRVAEHFRK